jgi:Leucine-rich repeat (LRR) protein
VSLSALCTCSPNHQELTLGYNHIKEIPKTVINLVNLTLLTLEHNELDVFPEELYSMQKLTKLDASANLFKELPDGIETLQHLTYLNLAENQISKLPEKFGTSPKLTELDLSANTLMELPEAIENLESLTNLDLHGNMLTVMPAEFCKITALKTLDLSHNKLVQFPVGMKLLKQLKSFDLNHNQLSRLSEQVGKMDSLTFFDVSYNKLTSLPPQLADVADMITLDVSHNLLAEIPDEFTLAGALPRLRDLRLEQNELAVLPDDIGNLTHLKKLSLEHNKIGSVPESITKMIHLTKLSLSFNELPGRPPILDELPELMHNNRSENPLEDVEEIMRGPVYDCGSALMAADAALEAGKQEEAIEYYDQALMFPEAEWQHHMDANAGRGIAFSQLGNAAMTESVTVKHDAKGVYKKIQRRLTRDVDSDEEEEVRQKRRRAKKAKAMAASFGKKAQNNAKFAVDTSAAADIGLLILGGLDDDPWPKPNSKKEASMASALCAQKAFVAAYKMGAAASAASAALTAAYAGAASKAKLKKIMKIADETQLAMMDRNVAEAHEKAEILQAKADEALGKAQSLAVNPFDRKLAWLYYNQGLLFTDVHRFGEAVSSFIRGQKLAQKYNPMTYKNCVARYRLGQHSQAEQEYTALVGTREARYAGFEEKKAQRVIGLQDRDKPMHELKERQSVEVHRLQYKHKQQVKKITKVQEREVDKLLAQQEVEAQALKEEHRRLRKEQQDKMKLQLAAERNYDEVMQLAEAHERLEKDLANEQKDIADQLIAEHLAVATEIGEGEEAELAEQEEKHKLEIQALVPTTEEEIKVAESIKAADRYAENVTCSRTLAYKLLHAPPLFRMC